MTRKDGIGCVFGLLSVLIAFPLSFTLSYLTMKHINATDVMWLIFWLNWPISISFVVGAQIVKELMK